MSQRKKSNKNIKKRKMPAWLKGGIVGLIVVIILQLTFTFMTYGPEDYSSPIINAISYLELFITLTIGLPIVITEFFTCFKFCSTFQDILIRVIWYIIYILAGALLGHLVRNPKDK